MPVSIDKILDKLSPDARARVELQIRRLLEEEIGLVELGSPHRAEPKPRKSQDPAFANHGAPWTEARADELKRLYLTEGRGAQEIAAITCRTLDGIKAQLVRLGVEPNRESVRL